MTAAQTNPDPTDSRADDFLDAEDRRTNYREALNAAQCAAETTDTPAWIANYREQVQRHRRIVQGAAEEIANCNELVKEDGGDEETDKMLKAAVKRLTEERVAYNAWRDRAVRPFSNTVDRLAELALTYRREAAMAEEASPLQFRGLAEAVGRELDSWWTARWDDEDGVVLVFDPKVDEEG